MRGNMMGGNYTPGPGPLSTKDKVILFAVVGGTIAFFVILIRVLIR